MQPSHLVSIETRRHIVPNPTKTRFGVGDATIDHAAGLPLHSRHSSPPQPPAGFATFESSMPPPASVPAYARTWGDEANIHDSGMLRARLRGDDAPVDLPLKPRWTTYAIVAVILVAFAGVGLSILFAGRTKTLDDLPREEPAAAHDQGSAAQ